jgi:muconolactone D-isomerase
MRANNGPDAGAMSRATAIEQDNLGKLLMEFLTHIRIRNEWLHQSPEEKAPQLAAEREAAARLQAEKKLHRMWRDPGTIGNYILWRVKDQNELHDIISSLPAFPWFEEVKVITLGAHPVDPESSEV